MELLREVYGEALFIIGLQATLKARRALLIRRHRTNPLTVLDADVRENVDDLLERDFQEASDRQYGQDILKTLPMSDAFIDTSRRNGKQVRRIVSLIFRSPRRPSPTLAELSMSIAATASAMSPELGRRVGAALVKDHSVVSSGANIHPQSSKIPGVDSSLLDVHDLLQDLLNGLNTASLLKGAASNRLATGQKAFVAELLTGPLKGSRVRDITEFQLAVHAEMNVILAALRAGQPIQEGTIYVTDYPCHSCAKHLLALRIKVVYLQPYPKSRAESMFGSTIGRKFKPFTGIAPRRFTPLFEVEEDRKSTLGVVRSPDPHDEPFVQYPLNREEVARRELNGIEESKISDAW